MNLNTEETKRTNGIYRLRELFLPGQLSILAGCSFIDKSDLGLDLISLPENKYSSCYITLNEDAEEIARRLADRNAPCIVFQSINALSLFDISALPIPFLIIDSIPCGADEDLSDFFADMKAFASAHNTSVIIISEIYGAEKYRIYEPDTDDLPEAVYNCLDAVDNLIFLYKKHSGIEDEELLFENWEAPAGDGSLMLSAKCLPSKVTILLNWDKARKTFL